MVLSKLCPFKLGAVLMVQPFFLTTSLPSCQRCSAISLQVLEISVAIDPRVLCMSSMGVGSFAINCVTLSVWLPFSEVQVSLVENLPEAEEHWSIYATRVESIRQITK